MNMEHGFHNFKKLIKKFEIIILTFEVSKLSNHGNRKFIPNTPLNQIS